MNYFFKKAIWKGINFMPRNLRSELIRKQFKVDPPTGVYLEVQYKIAQTRDELEQAFTLIQDSYLEMNLTDTPESMRLGKYNALPTTLVFIAIYQGEVIATISQIMDTALGLPIETFCRIGKLRTSGRRISEISGLAIKKEWRSRSTGIFFPLSTFAMLYCRKYVGVDYFVIVTRAHVRFFYQALYDFKGIDSKVKNHSGVKEKKSYAQFLDVEKLDSYLKKHFNHNRCGFNFLNISLGFPESFPWRQQCIIQKLKYNICSNQLFMASDLSYFFIDKTSIISGLSKEDLRVLKTIYSFTGNESLITGQQFNEHEDRKDQRYIVNLKMDFSQVDSVVNHKAKVIEISRGGFAVLFEDTSLAAVELNGTIYLNKDEKVKFKAKACWTQGMRVGYRLINIDDNKWMNIINYCHQYSCHDLSWDFEQVA